MALLSILIPLYNEEEFIRPLLNRVLEAPLPDGLSREIIVVDDGSTDGSAEIVEEITKSHTQIRLIRAAQNRGKGAAVRTAIEAAQGEYCIIQDADLEYDPREYCHLLKPLVEGKADAVFGSRFMVTGERRVLYFWHSLANRILTGFANILTDLNLTDMETCYKAFRTSLIQSIPLRSERFGIEPEITMKLAQRQARIYETPISYYGRTYDEGKKIGLPDAFEAIWVLVRFKFSKDIYRHSGGETLDALSAAPKLNRWMADTIRPYVGERVLEIGAGIGNLTRALLPRRKCYVATDIDAEHLARLSTRFQHRPNLRVRFCDLTDPAHFTEFEGMMDSVICLNVLEHVEDDLQGLRNIYSALRPGGRAIVLVPHDMRIYGTIDKMLGHYRRYTHEELRTKMEQTGFRFERMLEFNRISRYPWWFSGRVLKQEALGVGQMRVFDRLVWLWRKIDSSLPWPPVSIIGIAVKP
jgi:glycosyltransferase involved in cell wall biosynthesis